MKSKIQIKKFIAQCDFGKEWCIVKNKCNDIVGKDFVHKGLHPVSKATYQDFEDWLESDFGVGDVVQYGNTIGILNVVTPEKVSLGAYYARKKKVLYNTLLIDRRKLSHISKELEQQFHKDLLSAGFALDRNNLVIVESFMPKAFSFVKMQQGESECIGIVDSVEVDKIKFIVALDNNEFIKDTTKTLTSDTTFCPFTKQDTAEFNTVLCRNGYKWEDNKLHKLIKRAKKGGKYWYLTDNLTVKNAVDMDTRQSKGRYMSGNYFTDQKEAIEFMVKTQQLLASRTKVD